MTAPPLFATGGITVDNVRTADGGEACGLLGGGAVYAAAGARLWHGRAGVVAVAPSNLPVGFLPRLAAAGIDPEGVATGPGAVTCDEWMEYAADGDRRDHLRAGSGRSFADFRAAWPVLPAHVPAKWMSARAVHLAPNRPDAQLELALWARAAGLVVTLDPGFHAAALDLAALLPLLDAFLPSERELRAVCPGMSDEAGLHRFVALGVPVAAVKLGGAGALVLDGRTGVLTEVPALSVPVRDPTGAGDAWCGGFLAGLCEAVSPAEAARRGAVSASFAVEAFGPGGLLAATPNEALTRLQSLMCPPAPETAA